MKRVAIAIMLLAFAAFIVCDDWKFQLADDDTLKDGLNNFHKVMGALWHGPIQENNIEPLETYMAKLEEHRDEIMKANLPTEFKHIVDEASAKAMDFSRSVTKLSRLYYGGAEVEEITKAFSDMHDAYRDFRTMVVSVNVYVERFHDAMHPLWHEAYPAKDAAAIKENVGELVKWSENILKANTGKEGDIEQLSKKLDEAVADLKTKCESGTDEEILASLAAMHDAYHAIYEE